MWLAHDETSCIKKLIHVLKTFLIALMKWLMQVYLICQNLTMKKDSRSFWEVMHTFFQEKQKTLSQKTKCILLTIYSSSTFHVWRCSKLILSLAACCGSSFVRDLKIDETNEVENAYGIFICNLQLLLDFLFTIVFKI